MKVLLTKKDKKRQSKHGSFYIRCYFKGIEDNKSYRLDVYENHNNSRKWLEFLKEQAIFDNVLIYNGNILDGNSNFKYLGIKK